MIPSLGRCSGAVVALATLLLPPSPGQDPAEELRAVLGQVEAARADGALDEARSLLASFLEGGVFTELLEGDDSLALEHLSAIDAAAAALGMLAAVREVREERFRRLAADRPPTDPERLGAEQALAVARVQVGDVAGAVELLEHVHEVRDEVLPDGHPELLRAKQNLAGALFQSGDLDRAHGFFQEVHDARSAQLPPEHPDLLAARSNLALARRYVGDLVGALALEEQVHDAWTRSVAPDDPNLLRAKQNLAASRRILGDLAGALELEEAVHDARVRLLPAEHPDLLAAKSNLAATRKELGDLEGAREMEEYVASMSARVLPPDHPNLLIANTNLAVTLDLLDDVEEAHRLFVSVHDARARTLSPDHPALLNAKLNLAMTHSRLGHREEAAELEEAVHAARARLLPPDHPDLLIAKTNLAATRKALGDLDAALELEESVLAVQEQLLPPDHYALLLARQNLVETRFRQGDRVALAEDLRALLEGQRARAVTLHEAPQRVAREVALAELRRLGRGIFWADSTPGERRAELDALLFSLLESLRAVSTSSRQVAFAAARLPELAALRAEAADARRRISDMSVAAPEDPAEIERWRQELVRLGDQRDRLQRRLRSALAQRGVATDAPTAASIARRLSDEEALVSFLRYRRADGAGRSVDALVAFVLSPDATINRVDLGPAADVERLAVRWRRAVGRPLDPTGDPASPPSGPGARGLALKAAPVADDEAEVGSALRERLLDPCLATLADSPPKKLRLILDDFLHLLPIAALPDAEGRRLGETIPVRIEVSARRLLEARERSGSEGTLVVVGGVDFDAASTSRSTGQPDASPESASAPGRFAALPHTLTEARELARLYGSERDDEPVVLLAGEASKAALREHASAARFLHIATHGWFAPESFRSLIDASAEQAARDLFARAEQTLVGFAPETLCGVALAGANRGAGEPGRTEGILTAEELAGLDLSSCELAVLSACETNVGIRRAGQGIQSLQGALHAAGARTAVTSLWRVDDAATRRLMTLFYSGLWRDGLGKADALWRAKMSLRAEGGPLRDWAGWVLTGDAE